MMQDPSMWKRHLLRPQLWSFFGPEVMERNLDKDRVNAYIGMVDRFLEFWSLSFVGKPSKLFHMQNYSTKCRIVPSEKGLFCDEIIPQAELFHNMKNSSEIHFFFKGSAKVEKVGHLQNEFSTRICAQGP